MTQPNETLYRKNNKGRYIPVGISTDRINLTDGIWRVRNSPDGLGITNMDYLMSLYKMMGLNDTLDIRDVDSIETLCEDFTSSDVWKKLMINTEGYTLLDVIRALLAYLQIKK